MYIPPNASTAYHTHLLNYIQSLISTPNLVLMGDFNTPSLHWDTFTGYDDFTSQLCDILFDLNLFQYIDKPTHVHGNILDVVFGSIMLLQISCQLYPECHRAVS